VSFPINDSDLPTIIKAPSPGIALQINMKSPRLNEIEEIMRSIEGMWSFWGLESITIQMPKHEWISENEEEEKKLQLVNFSYSKKELNDEEIEPISFDLLARPIISAVKKQEHDVIFSFYRRGSNDIREEEYIEAIYDFYFVLESFFANGKSKNYLVEKEFKESEKLRNHITDLCDHSKFLASLDTEDRTKCKRILDGKSVDKIIKFLINTRGFLHHHTTKRKDIWNPEKQDRFRPEALIFQDLCHKVVFEMFLDRIYESDIISEYEGFVLRNNTKPSTVVGRPD
jgi:hypothetical protein